MKCYLLCIVSLLVAVSVVTAQNSFASPISGGGGGGNPCCTQPTSSPCTPAPQCGDGPTVEAEEAMPPNGCGETHQDPCGGAHAGLRMSASDLNAKLEKDIETPGMLKMEQAYRKQELQRKRDIKENDNKKRKLGAKLAKQMKARVALKNLEEQLSKQLSEVRSTIKVLGMQMRMTKNQLDNQSLDEPKLRVPKMPIMSTLKKMHGGQLKDLKGTHTTSQDVVQKAITQAQAGFSPGSIPNSVGKKLKKQEIKNAKRLVKKLKKDMKKDKKK